MKNVVIWGAGDLGVCLYELIKNQFRVLFFIDNRQDSFRAGLPVLHPSALKTADFDMVYIASAHGLEDIYAQLVNEFNIPREKINRIWAEAHLEKYFIAPRIRFLEDFAEFCYLHGLEGACAEVGVCSGDFAAEINRVFSDRKLYLFDTFEGFDDRDLTVERSMNHNYSAIDSWIADGQMAFTNTSIELVRKNLPFPNQAVIKKGFFPDTFDSSSEQKFIFVNLDTDLYQPIKDGLELFYPRMERGGMILIHDYYSMLFGVKKAVDEFMNKYNIVACPIGDYKSIAIIRNG